MKETGLLMGEVAKQAGVNRETIRYYERIGLLQRPLRTTWITVPRQQLPEGFLISQAQFPALISALMVSGMVEYPFSRISSNAIFSVKPKQ